MANIETSYIYYLRCKIALPSGKFYFSNYCSIIREAFIENNQKNPLQSSVINASFHRMVKDGFATIITKDGEPIGFQLISWYNSLVRIEGYRHKDKRRSMNNISSLSQKNVNELENACILQFTKVPTKQELITHLSKKEITSLLDTMTLKVQQIADGISKDIAAKFQNGNTGGVIIALTRLNKILLGYKGAASAHKTIQKLVELKAIVKNTRYKALSPEETKHFWNTLCIRKYQKHSTMAEWVEDQKQMFGVKDFYLDQIDPEKGAYRYKQLVCIMDKLVKGEELDDLHQQVYQEILEENLYRPNSNEAPEFLSAQELAEFEQMQKSCRVPLDYLKSLCNSKDEEGEWRRVIIKDKILYKALANEYFIYQEGMQNKVVYYDHHFPQPNSTFFTVSPNVQKTSLTPIIKLQEKNLQLGAMA